MKKDKVSLHGPTNRAGTHAATYDPVVQFFLTEMTSWIYMNLYMNKSVQKQGVQVYNYDQIVLRLN